METEFALLQRALTLVLNLSFALLAGASAASLWLRAKKSPWAAALLPRLRTTLLGASGLGVMAYAAILWVEAASMAEVPLSAAWPAVMSVLTATHYGLAWMIGAAALAAIVATSMAGACAPLRLAAIGILFYSRSMVSHAGAGGDFTWAIVVDWIHLVLVSLWAGEVIVAGLVALRRPPGATPDDRSDCLHYVEALSHSATLALAGIVATGALSAWRVLDSPSALVGSPYGTTLLVKLGLVLCAAALGGSNRFLVMPSLLRSLRQAGAAAQAPERRFARILQAEAIVLVAALAAAAFLTAALETTHRR